MPEMVKVKAAGWRGWKRILACKFDPTVHEIYDARTAPDDTPPPAFDRECAESRARELGVSFNARTKDEVLRQRIAEAEG